MFKKMCFVVTVIVLLFASNVSTFAANEEGIEMKAVVDAIKKGLQNAANAEVPGFNQKLSSAKIELKTTVSRKVGGGINFWIFSFGASKEKEATSTITIEMKAPKKEGGAQSYKPPANSTSIADAIIAAEQSYVEASSIDPRLTEGVLTLSFNFLVKTSVNGGVKIAELIPVGIDASESYSKSQVHTITLTFSKV